MSCVGIDGRNPIVYQKDGVYTHKTMTAWIDKLITDNAANVVIDGAVEKLAMNDPTLKIWCTDQVGLPQEKQITSVQRTDLTKLEPGSYSILRFNTQNGTTVRFASDTPLVTRVNNEIGQIPAKEWNTDDPKFMIACNLWNFVLRTGGPELVQYAVQPHMPVPEVITATWGVMTITRGNALDLIDVCDNYPESIDPGDRAVFDEVLTEMIQYDPITAIQDDTSQMVEKYVYWIETEWGNFASFINGFFCGQPHISPLYTPPLSQDKISEAKDKGANDVHEVLKAFKQAKSDEKQ